MKILKATIILLVLNMAIASCDTTVMGNSAMAQTIEQTSSY